MSSIPHTFWFNHLTEVGGGVKWRGEDHDAAKIVKGLKQEPFNGYLRWRGRDYTTKTMEEFVDYCMPALGEAFADSVNGKLAIVPIPNSNMAVGEKGTFRIIELAEKFANGIGERAVVTPAIR